MIHKSTNSSLELYITQNEKKEKLNKKLCPIHCISYDRKFVFFKFKVAWNSDLLKTDFSF